MKKKYKNVEGIWYEWKPKVRYDDNKSTRYEIARAMGTVTQKMSEERINAEFDGEWNKISNCDVPKRELDKLFTIGVSHYNDPETKYIYDNLD